MARTIFHRKGGRAFLPHHNVLNAVDLGQTLHGSVLANGVKLRLERRPCIYPKWSEACVEDLWKLKNSHAVFDMYKGSPEHSVLKSHGVKKAWATSLKYPDGICSPYTRITAIRCGRVNNFLIGMRFGYSGMNLSWHQHCIWHYTSSQNFSTLLGCQ